MVTTIGPIDLFGRATVVEVDDSPAAPVLAEELSAYPAASGDPARSIEVTHAAAPTRGMPNPTSHVELSDGFVARYPNVSVRYRLDARGRPHATIHLAPSVRGLRRARRRWRSIQYATPDEAVGQVVHELAAIPMLYWDDDRVPVHASAVELPAAGMTLIGGTGGSGKTSLAIELCRRHGAAFAADDMSIVGPDGTAYPNLAFPKVYGYNLEGSPELRARVLGSAGRLERWQWAWRGRRVGPAGVRRRIAPALLHDRVVAEPRRIRRYVVLVREDRERIATEPLDAERAASMSLAVLRAEYADHHRHLAWHAFNTLAAGRRPSVDLEARFAAWQVTLAGVLATVECLAIRVPTGMGATPMRARLALELTGA